MFKRSWETLCCSLVPRPFPPPDFDRLLYAKTEGKGLEDSVTCVTSGRREGDGARSLWLTNFALISLKSTKQQKLYYHCLSNVTVSSSWTRYYKDLEILQQALPPTLLSTWCHSHDSISQAFPLCFCTQRAIKNWRQGTAWEWGYLRFTDAICTHTPEHVNHNLITLEIDYT